MMKSGTKGEDCHVGCGWYTCFETIHLQMSRPVSQTQIFIFTCIFRFGQNRIYTPYMTVHLVIFLPKIPYIHRIYMVLANPMYV